MSGAVAARSRTGRSTERGGRSRDRILEAAEEVLAERGYIGTSISAVCERAGIAPTSVYWHFGSKAGLLEALLRRHGGGHFEAIRAAAEGGSPLERLENMLRAIRALALGRPPGSLTALAVLEEGRHVTPELRAAMHTARLREIEETADEFAAVVGGRTPEVDAAAVLVMACANYAALTHVIEADPAEIDRILDALRRAVLALAGLRPGGTGPTP